MEFKPHQKSALPWPLWPTGQQCSDSSHHCQVEVWRSDKRRYQKGQVGKESSRHDWTPIPARLWEHGVWDNSLITVPWQLKMLQEFPLFLDPIIWNSEENQSDRCLHMLMNLCEIPKDIFSLNCTVVLVGDVFFVNGMSFLFTLLRKIQLLSVEHVCQPVIIRLAIGTAEYLNWDNTSP